MQYAIQCHHQTTHKWSWHTAAHKVQSLSALQAYAGSRCIAPFILCLSTRWRWAVSCMHQPLYTQERTQIWAGWVGPGLVSCLCHNEIFLQTQMVDEEPICTKIGPCKHYWWMQEPICAAIGLCTHYWWMKSTSVPKLVFASTTGGWRAYLWQNWSLQALLVNARAHLCCNWTLHALMADEEHICAKIGLCKHYWWMKSLSVQKLVFASTTGECKSPFVLQLDFASTTGGWRACLCWNWSLQALLVDAKAHLCCNWSLQALLVDARAHLCCIWYSNTNFISHVLFTPFPASYGH